MAQKEANPPLETKQCKTNIQNKIKVILKCMLRTFNQILVGYMCIFEPVWIGENTIISS